MTELLKELNQVRKRWLESHNKKDLVMESLWLRIGLKLREQLDKRLKNPPETS